LSRFPVRSLALLTAALAFSVFGLSAVSAAQVAGRSALPQIQRALPTGAADAGDLPSSQPMSSIVIQLKRTQAQQADLDAFLATQQKSGSPDYHHWMTPAEFAKRFAPADDVVAPVKTWLATQGLQIQSTSAGGMRLTVSGTAQQTATAFGIHLHRLSTLGGDGVMVDGTPSIPSTLAASIGAVSGLQTVPGTTDGVSTLADAVDANASPIVVADLTTTGSLDELNSVLEQASAQGQTILVLHADPAELPSRALSLVLAGDPAVAASPLNSTPRPNWQAANNLPPDSLRAIPDAAVATDTNALVAAFQTIISKAGTRQGEVASTFYKLAPKPGIFSHADSTLAADSWSATDGLGTVNVDALLKAWPYGVTVPQSATIALSSRTVTHGATITLTATITGGSGTPTGTITFASTQAGTLGTAPLNASGIATYTTNSLAGGLYGFFGTYSGDNTYDTAITNVDTATILPETVTVTGTVPATPIGVGSTIPVTVTVVVPSGVGTPTGAVTVYPYGTNIATQTFTGTLVAGTAAGIATALVNVPATNVGAFSFQANCVTNASFSCATPASFPVTVAKGTPVVTLAAPATTSGSSVTLTATVAAPAGSSTAIAAPTGSVQFLDGTTVLGTGAITAGMATFTGALAPGSTHSLTAVYSGDANWAGGTSNGSATGTPTGLLSIVALTSSVTAGTAGQSITFTATVTSGDSTSVIVPTGTVTFYDTISGILRTLGTSRLVSGVATLSTTGLIAGTHNITATYSGDTVYLTSKSSVLPINIGDFTVTFVPASLQLTAGSTGTATALVSAVNNFTGTVALSCTAPADTLTTCTIAPSVVTIGSTAQITITTTANKASAIRPALPGMPIVPQAIVAAGMVGLFSLCFVRRRRVAALFVVMLALLLASGGCGTQRVDSTNNSSGGSAPPGGGPMGNGSPLGTYNFTVTAASGNATVNARHNFMLSVTVQ
jgi:hypothetical protein